MMLSVFAELPQGGACCIAVAMMFPALILVAFAIKMWEIWKAKSWLAAEGKVLASRVKTQEKSRSFEESGDTEFENVPFVEYEFRIGSQKHRGTRITIGEKIHSSEVEATLARYPVGKAVTVYYDPADPKKCLLERDLGMSNTKLWLGFGGIMLVFVGGPLLLVFSYFNGVEWFKSHLANPRNAPFVTAMGLFGLVMLIFALAFTRMVLQSRRWPVVTGTILETGVREVVASDSEGRRMHYQPRILYRYTVDGREYQGDRVVLGVSVSTTVSGFARWRSGKYQPGQSVDVHYNPAAPGEAVLNVNSNWHFLPWFMAAVVLGFTWAVATGRV